MDAPPSPLQPNGSRGEQLVARTFAGLLWAVIAVLSVLAVRAIG